MMQSSEARTVCFYEYFQGTNPIDRLGSGQSGNSPRVTLRLNQVRGTRDEKKNSSNSRQGGVNAQGQNQMEGNSTKSSGVPATSGNNAISPNSNSGGAGGGGGSTWSVDNNDVYEFKSSKEATPVRGSSISPNPEKDNKETAKSSGSQNSSGGGGGNTTASGGCTSNSSTGETSTTSGIDEAAMTTSPSSKRPFEGDANDDQDDENRKKKRKDGENPKDNVKGGASGRQGTGRSGANAGEKCTKSGKQGLGATSGKNNQSSGSTNIDRKSPSAAAAAAAAAASSASSPKPSGGTVTSGLNPKTTTTTPAPHESDSEDGGDRSKLDSNSAPKVPPLKIVIPQSTTSEQEQGNRNGKNTSNRSHQLPYVVASSNSNDSTEKDQNQSASGTTSPTEAGTTGGGTGGSSGTASKAEEKKDFAGALHGEERSSTHHQRVLRSSHRGNGGNGSANSKESSSSSSASSSSSSQLAGNGNYSNSSPLPGASADRSNNSSPQPTPEVGNSEANKTQSNDTTTTTNTKIGTSEKVEKNSDNIKAQKDNGNNESMENSSTMTSSSSTSSSSSSSTTSTNITTTAPVELHPRKRKIKPNKESQQSSVTAANETSEATSSGPEVHPHDQPITNCYQLFLNIRKQIESRRKGLFPVQPKPPQGFKDYLMNRCTYVLAGNRETKPNVNIPAGLIQSMKDLYVDQEKYRHRLRMQHVVEKEKLVLSVEQEILRVHGRAARALANQSLPFSVCTILKDEEVYNVITPEQEEKDRNARSRYNGRLFLSWLQDVDDKWEKIKEAMLLRHHNEAESLHAVQRMDWEWKLKEVGLCEFKATPQIEDLHVPMVHVADDFDLLPT
ncbi:uncharacterized transmembrane protein DDB_G0289901 isoform X3 [Leptopilina boulardi]|uniref:uncharacterized transmembrane protein DDB_G0289901 isoform X3 n=1 Tax=Leptopilina boulardi TaxID=63433 RepID=UPI0021F66E77|nr:uncharacterized transmembrane protein DDB_G0289901 isoform X3 [Leptopilina boulardi]